MNEPIDIQAERVSSQQQQQQQQQQQPEPSMAVAVRQTGGAVGQPLSLEQISERLRFIRSVMGQEMKEGQDYGKIPGTGDKPSLLQPGAQKLLLTFNLREQVKRETLREYPNWHREYELVVTVFPAGQRPEDGWDGVGTCSTLESKYRYRKAERKCPICHKSSIIKGKEEYGGGYVCFKKKNGCGAKFADDDQRILSQPADDVENEDPADVWNCVPLNTRILTQNGFRAHSAVRVGDLVLAYNPEARGCEWTPLEAITRFDSAPLVRMSNRTTELVCTPNHSWVVWDPRTKDPRLAKTSDLRHNEIVRAASAPSGDAPMSPREAAILGWLLTDGSIRPGGYATISQCSHRYADEIRSLLGEDVSSIATRDRQIQSIIGVACMAKPLQVFNLKAKFSQRLLLLAGIRSKHEVPSCLASLSADSRKAMLRAMLHADGHFRESRRGGFDGGSWIFTKQIPSVMETFRILATLEGLKIGRAHGQITVNGNYQPRQEICSRQTTTAKSLTLESLAPQAVWCPTTKFGTWVMEQDGNVSITGNTVRKMAFKRALVAAAINATNTSELWTQDLEDMAANPRARSQDAPGRAEPAPRAPAPTPRAQSPAPQAPATPAPRPAAAPEAPKAPTETTRTWAIGELEKFFGLPAMSQVDEYLKKAGILMETEDISEIPLRFVPASRDQLNMLKGSIGAFMDGGEAVKPAYSNPEPTDTAKRERKAKPVEVPRDPAPVAPPPTDPQSVQEGEDDWWRHIIVPIPRKGMKRAEYMQNPDTIGSLYDLRHEETADGQDARRRLWGLVNNYEAKPWTGRDGKEHAPSESDRAFREALDVFQAWFEKEHPNDKL